MTYAELKKSITVRLKAAEIPDAETDSRLIISEASGKNAAELLACLRDEAPEETVLKADAYAARRERSEPLQLIFGYTGFMGLRFSVNGSALIPRQDTEILVEKVLEYSKKKTPSPKKVLDLCTGSGCIAVSLAALGGFETVTATDISEEAIKNADENIGLNSPTLPVRPRLLQGDLFAPVCGERFDIIVSNPPYIKTADIAGLMPEVRNHDPHIALDGGADGLDFYRRIAAEAPSHLTPGGAVFLEIGFDQAEAVTALLEAAGFKNIIVYKDYSGNDRVATGSI